MLSNKLVCFGWSLVWEDFMKSLFVFTSMQLTNVTKKKSTVLEIFIINQKSKLGTEM
jgi:hypothetical protein